MCNIIRKINLNKLGIYQIKDSEKELFDFVRNKLLSLKIMQLDNNYFIYYFNNNGKNVFQYNLNQNILYVNYNFWDIISKIINDDIKVMSIFKNIGEKIYKLKIQNTYPISSRIMEDAENYFHSKYSS